MRGFGNKFILFLGAASLVGFTIFLSTHYDNGVPQNDETAVRWYKRSAEQGNVTAQKALGWIYKKGYGVSENYKTAIKWYRLAAEQGDADAQHRLGGFYEKGRGVIPRDYKGALKWFKLNSDQNYMTAIKWYRLADEQGYAEAKLDLEYLQKKIEAQKTFTPEKRACLVSPDFACFVPLVLATRKDCDGGPLTIKSEYYLMRVHIPVSVSCPSKPSEKQIIKPYYDSLIKHVFYWMFNLNDFDFSRIGIAENLVTWDFYFEETAYHKNLKSFLIRIKNESYYHYPGYFTSTIILHGPEHKILTYDVLFGEKRIEALSSIINYVRKELISKLGGWSNTTCLPKNVGLGTVIGEVLDNCLKVNAENEYCKKKDCFWLERIFEGTTQDQFTKNFTIWQSNDQQTPKGITVHFEMYEVGSRPEGEIDINVPHSVFSSFLKSEISEYFSEQN